MVTDRAETRLLSGHRGGGIVCWSLRSLPQKLTPLSCYRAHADGVVVGESFFARVISPVFLSLSVLLSSRLACLVIWLRVLTISFPF